MITTHNRDGPLVTEQPLLCGNGEGTIQHAHLCHQSSLVIDTVALNNEGFKKFVPTLLSFSKKKKLRPV